MRALCLGLAALAVGLIATTASASQANVATPNARGILPVTVPFQGFLTDDVGIVVDGMVDLDLAIYAVDSGGVALWSESHPDVVVDDGLFTVYLGSVAPMPPGLFDGTARYLGIAVDGEAELPRTALGVTPSAAFAYEAEAATARSSGFTERVTSLSDLALRRYYLDPITPWGDLDASVFISVGGDNDPGTGVVTVLVNGATVFARAFSVGNSAWTVSVPLSVSGTDRVEVLVRSDSASVPFLVRDIRLDVVGASSAMTSLDDAYDVGPIITTDAGPVSFETPGQGRVDIHSNSVHGGSVELFDEAGDRTIALEPAFVGEGGFLTLFGPSGAISLSSTSTAGPSLYLGPMSFLSDNSGDASVNLPNGAITASEIGDVVGLASGRRNNIDLPSSSEMVDVATTTVTLPADGYVLLLATAQGRVEGSDRIEYQIDETPGGSRDPDQYHFVGSFEGTGDQYAPVSTQRIIFKTKGTYTFRFEARKIGTGSNTGFWNTVLTAVYLPVSHGPVIARVGEGEQAVPGGDLRELELAAARARVAAQAAELRLIEARRENGERPYR